MEDQFLIEASKILAHNSKGFSGKEIVEIFKFYSSKFNKEIIFKEEKLKIGQELYIKRLAFKKNLEIFTDEEKFIIISELCRNEKFNNTNYTNTLEENLYLNYSHLNTFYKKIKQLDFEIISRTANILNDFPESKSLYTIALKNLNLNYFQRNILDELRLSLELLMKSLFNNNKPLENQVDDFLIYIKKGGGSIEYVNLFNDILEYYCKYCDTYKNSDDNINIEELEFIFETTSVLIRKVVHLKQNYS
ncbi:MAG TPA: hypothetical protein VIG94_03830 [Faecalibacter sp.]